MKNKVYKFARALHPKRLTSLARYLLQDEAISGKLILLAVALALLVANTPFAPWYEELFRSKINLGLGDLDFTFNIRQLINDGLMVFFFLVVGLELKRELVYGELRDKKSAILPLAAAIGGMVLPALIFAGFNLGKATISGWAIPTATDVALVIGLLALLGRRIPSSVRIFLLTLAIVDDILAVVVIAVFYSTGLNPLALAGVLGLALLCVVLGKWRILPMWAFIVIGIAIWVFTAASGVHPSITGVVLGAIAPIMGERRPSRRIAERIEKAIIPFSTLVVIPLFAFANTGISFGDIHLNLSTALPLGGGIIAGLVIGKTLGILGASWLAVRAGIAKIPAYASWQHILGVGSLAGIGFTVSIFVTNLAFKDIELIMSAKLSIFIASTVAALFGLAVLRRAKMKPQ